MDSQRTSINRGKALSDLKRKYVDLAKAHGTESKEAKDAAEAIRKLSAEYKTNKTLAEKLAKEANSFDLSLGGEDAAEGVEKTNDNVIELEHSLEAIRNLDFMTLFGSAFQGLHKGLEKAKAEWDEAKVHIEYSFSSLFKNGKYYRETGEQWKGLKEGAKGFGESGKLAIEGIGKAITALIDPITLVMTSVALMLAGVVATVMGVIGLVKNAMTVAKEVKAMATQSSKSGMDTNTFQEWGYVFKQVGVEEDKLVDFTKKLAEKQNELRDGTEGVAEAFEAIGISQEEVLGSNQEELFSKTVQGLQNVENEAERTSASFRIFTDDATDLTNLLYLTNEETRSLVDNYYDLGGAPSENLINKSKVLEGSTTNLSYAWQGLKNTLAEWVIPAVIAVVQWLTTAVAVVNAVLQGIFGIKPATEKASKGLDNVGSGVGKIGTGAKKATSAVKELLRYTMGFDELNIIPKQSTGGSGSDSGSDTTGINGYSNTGINPELPVIDVPDLSKLKEFMAEYGGIIQGLLTWAPIIVGMFMILTATFTGAIPLMLVGIGLVGLGIGIGAAGGENSHWNKLANGIKKVWNDIKNWFKTYVAPVFTKEWWAEKWDKVSQAADEKLDELVAEFGLWWADVRKWWKDNIAPVFTKEFWATKWDNIKTAASEKLTELKAKIDEKTAPIKKWFEDKVKPIFTKEYWITKWNNIKQAASEKIGEIKQKIDEKLSPLKSWFNNKLKPIFTSDFWKSKWNTVKDGAKSAFNGVIEIVEKAINSIIKRINTISWDIPDWVPKIGGEKFGFNFKQVSIPRLAEGGIATSSILANIGERGREAVLPLENHTEWMDVLAARINNNAPSKIVLMVDGRELGYASINSINSITKQTGTLQLQLV